MNEAELDLLIEPLGDESPCGPDLEYDASFIALEVESRGKPEQQFGDTVIAAQEPNWRTVQVSSLELLHRSRDIRLVVHLLRAMTHTSGTLGFAKGIRLLSALLDRHWSDVHPQLDASDGDDPTMRLNALAPLATTTEVLADLRQANVGEDRFLTARAVELALGKGEVHEGESVPGMSQLSDAASSQLARDPEGLIHLQQMHESVKAIQRLLEERVGSSLAPDLKSLIRVTQALASFAGINGSTADATKGSEDAAPVQGQQPAVAGNHRDLGIQALGTRQDAIQALDRVCDWIERHEPTNPAPLLIRRAQRLMTKNFIEIIRDIAPESLRDIERLAGVEAE